MSKEEADKTRNRERIEDDGMMLFSMFLAAGLAGGRSVAEATKNADGAVNTLRQRFT